MTQTSSNKQMLLPHEVQKAACSWHCSDPCPNGKNGRSALIWSGVERTQRPLIQLCMPNEACTVENVDATANSRYMYIEIKPTTERQTALLHYLDRYACDLAENKCIEWFGKAFTAEQLQSMYRPLANNETNTYTLQVPLKDSSVWRVSEARCRYSVATLNDIQAGRRILPCISVNGIYFKTREMGLSVTCTALVVFDATEPMPFHLGEGYELEDDTFREETLPEHEDSDAALSVH